MRHLTKLAHGLRPASLMLFLLRQVAGIAGAATLRGVGRETHAYWGHPRHGQIHFDYDAFWLEEGAERRADGLYTLSAQPRRRAPSELPSSKRALYARRYAWLDELSGEVRARWPAPAGRDTDGGFEEPA